MRASVAWLRCRHGVNAGNGRSARVYASGARAGGAPKVQLSPAVRAALQSPALTDQERAALRLRHGTWDEGDLTTPADRARAALAIADFASAALADPAAPAAVRAEALIASGRPQDALALVEKPLILGVF